MSQEKKWFNPTPRPVALLDVDHTLLFDNRLNINLVNALLQNGIKDVYLFTDMTFKQHSLDDRNELVQLLESYDFTVHGVITPNDLTWTDLPIEELKKLNKLCTNGTYQGKYVGEEFEGFIGENMEELPQIAKIVKQYMPTNKIPGKAFRAANAGCSEDIIIKSHFAKAFADHLGAKYNYAHNKGLLLDLFLRHKPQWVNSIVIADDNENVIKSVSNFIATNINDGWLKPDIPILVIPVESEKTAIAEYDQKLQDILPFLPSFLALVINNPATMELISAGLSILLLAAGIALLTLACCGTFGAVAVLGGTVVAAMAAGAIGTAGGATGLGMCGFFSYKNNTDAPAEIDSMLTEKEGFIF